MAKNAVAETLRRTLGPPEDPFWYSAPPEDTFAPTVPVITAAQALSTSQIQITFTKSVDAQSNVKEYACKYRQNGSTGAYGEHSRVSDTGAASYTKTLDTLAASTAYQIVVSAIDNAGNESDNSLPVVVTTQAGAVIGFNPGFPRLGQIANSDPQTYPLTSVWAQAYGRRHIAFVGGGGELWAQGRGYTREQFVRMYKDASVMPAGTLIFQYANGWEMLPNAPNHPSWYTKVQAENWWLYNSGTSGTKTPSNFRNTYNLVRYILNGGEPAVWFANYWAEMFFLGLRDPRNSAPSLDGIFIDNILVDPQVDGDWDADGTADDNLTEVAATNLLQPAQKKFFETLKSRIPTGKLLLGNIGDFGKPNFSAGVMNQVLHGGCLESVMGIDASSIESFNSFGALVARYHKTIDATKEPKLLMFGARCPVGNYALARYMACAALLGDGYLSLNPTTNYGSDPATWVVCDEQFGGVLDLGEYLGKRIGQRVTQPRWQGDSGGGGIYVAEFENGWGITWARKGVGPLTGPNAVAQPNYAAQPLGFTGFPLRGTLDAVTNNGGAGISTLPVKAPRNGLILMKTPQ